VLKQRIKLTNTALPVQPVLRTMRRISLEAQQILLGLPPVRITCVYRLAGVRAGCENLVSKLLM